MVITEVCGTSVFGSIPSQGTKKMSKENKLTPGLPQGFEDRWNKAILFLIVINVVINVMSMLIVIMKLVTCYLYNVKVVQRNLMGVVVLNVQKLTRFQ